MLVAIFFLKCYKIYCFQNKTQKIPYADGIRLHKYTKK